MKKQTKEQQSEYNWLKVFPESLWVIGWISCWDAFTRTGSELQLYLSMLLVVVGGIYKIL